MKPLNTMMYISNAAEELGEYKAKIIHAADYTEAKRIGNMALGYVNCMITFLNTMICEENNGLTGELDEVISSWRKSIYQAVIDKADETNQPVEVIMALLRKRDGEE